MIVFLMLLLVAFSILVEKQGHLPKLMSWRELESYLFGDQFKEGVRCEIDKFKEKGIYKEVRR